MKKDLIPPPRTFKALKDECSKLGLNYKNYNENNYLHNYGGGLCSEDKRKQLLIHIWNSYRLGRGMDRASILLVGSSGVGKSSTINHLFDLTEEQSSCFAKTSDATSETRTTTEFVLEVDSPERFKTSGLRLSLIDTPGFNDTDGTKQDVCNFYSIKKFHYKYMNSRKPNIVLVLIEATDKRIEGRNSNLAKSLRCLKALELIDTKTPNLVAVLTCSTSVGESAKKFTKNITRKTEIIKKTIFQSLQVNAPVVAIENDIEDLKKDGDYTILPDGTRQVKNLYTACQNILNANGDGYGHLIFNEAFCTDQKKIYVGAQVNAKIAKTHALSEPEVQFFQDYSLSLEGGLDPLVHEARMLIEQEKLEAVDAAEIQSLVNALRGMGVTDLTELQHISTKGINLKYNDKVSATGVKFLKKLGVKDTVAQISQDSASVIAQGYNILNDTVVPSQIFACKDKDTKFGIAIPEIAQLKPVSDTAMFMALYENVESLVKDRLSHLNVSLDIDCTPSSFASKAGFNLSSEAGIPQRSREMSFYLEERIFELSMGNFKSDKVVLPEDFKTDVSLLPSSFSVEDPESGGKFERFFNRWGHFVVTRATGGGSIEVKVNTSALNYHQSSDIDSIRASLAAFFSCGSTHNMDDFIVIEDGEQHSSLTAKQILASSTVSWKGGARELHKIETIQDQHLMDIWRNSLMTRPSMMTTDMYLEPISTLIQIVDPKKYECTYAALTHVLGGKFRVVTNKQRDEKELAEKRLKEAKEHAAKKKANETNTRNETIVEPPKPKECFPPTSLAVILRDGLEVQVKLEDLRIDDLVQGYDVKKKKLLFSPLILWSHADLSTITTYLYLELEGGSGIKITENHLIMVGEDHKAVMAIDAKPGDLLYKKDQGYLRIIAISEVNEQGLCAPITTAGNLFVDGVLASCYGYLSDVRIFGGRISAQTIGKIAFLPLIPCRRICKRKGRGAFVEYPDIHPYCRFLCKVAAPFIDISI